MVGPLPNPDLGDPLRVYGRFGRVQKSRVQHSVQRGREKDYGHAFRESVPPTETSMQVRSKASTFGNQGRVWRAGRGRHRRKYGCDCARTWVVSRRGPGDEETPTEIVPNRKYSTFRLRLRSAVSWVHCPFSSSSSSSEKKTSRYVLVSVDIPCRIATSMQPRATDHPSLKPRTFSWLNLHPQLRESSAPSGGNVVEVHQHGAHALPPVLCETPAVLCVEVECVPVVSVLLGSIVAPHLRKTTVCVVLFSCSFRLGSKQKKCVQWFPNHVLNC